MSLVILFTFVLLYLHTRPHLAAQVRERTPISFWVCVWWLAGLLLNDLSFALPLRGSCMVLFILISVCPTFSRIYSKCCNPLLVSAAMLGQSHRSAYSIFWMQMHAVFLPWYLYKRNTRHPKFCRCIQVQAIWVQASPLFWTQDHTIEKKSRQHNPLKVL